MLDESLHYCGQWLHLITMSGSYTKTTVVLLVGGNVVELHRAGEPCVCDPRDHEDLFFVYGDTKQGAGRLQRSQVLPLKLCGVVDTDPSHTFPT